MCVECKDGSANDERCTTDGHLPRPEDVHDDTDREECKSSQLVPGRGLSFFRMSTVAILELLIIDEIGAKLWSGNARDRAFGLVICEAEAAHHIQGRLTISGVPFLEPT